MHYYDLFVVKLNNVYTIYTYQHLYELPTCLFCSQRAIIYAQYLKTNYKLKLNQNESEHTF